MKTIVMIFVMLMAAPVASAENLIFAALSYREGQQVQISASPEKWTGDVEFYKNSTVEKENEVGSWIKEPRDIGEVFSIVADISSGVVAGYVMHEVGHYVAASATETKIWMKEFIISANCRTDADCRVIDVGGFSAQIMTTEAIFQSGEKNALNAGWLAFNIINSLGYVYEWEESQPVGDIRSFAREGGNVRALETVLLSHAFYTAYRFYNGGGEPLFNVATDTETGQLIISKNFKF